MRVASLNDLGVTGAANTSWGIDLLNLQMIGMLIGGFFWGVLGDRLGRRIALLTERNPRPEVAVFQLGPAAGRARIDTRIRLATSQQVLALAQLGDGTWWQHRVDVIVTLAACIES